MVCLESLREQAEKRDASGDVVPAIKLLYGKDLTLRGAQIGNLFRELRDNGEGANAEPMWNQLNLTVLEEIRDVTGQHKIYLEDNIQISRAQRHAALVPSGTAWVLMIRMENSFHRHIERKLTLLDRLQRTRRQAAALGSLKSPGDQTE